VLVIKFAGNPADVKTGYSVVDPDPVGSGSFWSDPEFLFQTGSGSRSGSDLFFHSTVNLKQFYNFIRRVEIFVPSFS